MGDLCADCIHCYMDEDGPYCELLEDPDDCNLYEEDWTLEIDDE